MRTEMINHRYSGNFKSGIVRAKKALIAAGFPWSVTTGRYHPFANEQRTTSGVRVTRLGCSGTITISVYDGNRMGSEARDTRRWVEALAIATLREAGMPFDDRGWLECENSY